MTKRVSVRNIVFFGEEVALMHRLKSDQEYYVFPGGGLEKGETLEQCAVREMMEEFGIVIRPIQQVFYYEDDKMIQHYMLSLYVSGDFGSGNGEEFYKGEENGFYIPAKHNLQSVQKISLRPHEIKDLLIENFELFKQTKLAIPFEIISIKK